MAVKSIVNSDISVRKKLIKIEDSLYIDSYDIVLSFCLKGSHYFVLGARPFGSETVIDYICYSRALLPLKFSPPSISNLLKELGFVRPITTKLSKLNSVEYLTVLTVCRLMTQKSIIINANHIPYTHGNKSRLNSFLTALDGAHYSVTVLLGDSRLLSASYELEPSISSNRSLISAPCSLRRVRKELKERGMKVDLARGEKPTCATRSFVPT